MAKINIDGSNYGAIITELEAYYYKGNVKVLLNVATGVADDILGGNGTDYIEAGAGADNVSGGNGKDTIYGGAGDDKLYGDTEKKLDTTDNGADTIYGGSGNDIINGGNGADTIYGDEKDKGTGTQITATKTALDSLLDDYRDTIDGGNGGDRIIGGLGGDTLTGGQGPDVFVYERIADSRTTNGENIPQSPVTPTAGDWQAETGDYITDFTKGQDKLDFTKLNVDNSALHFTGTTPATSGIWYLQSGGNTFLFADADGDGRADIGIKVKGNVTFDGNDFLGIQDGPDLAAPGSDGTVAEDVTNGATVGVTASATDPDGDPITYSLLDNAGGRFIIDSSTGVVTVADASLIDYESSGPSHSYTITVKATSNGGSDTQDYTIDVTNIAPSTPTDSDDGAGGSIAENASDNDTVGITASSTDVHGGTVTYSLTDDAGGRFQIDSSTGVVTIKDASLIDYESSGPSHSYTITVQASDGTDGSTQNFTIDVTNVAPSTPTDDDDTTDNTIAENVADGATVGITASSTDVHGGTVTYSLTDDASGRFTIDANTGVVTVADASLIDYESSGPSHSYDIKVVANDGADDSAEQTFTINVTNVAPSTPTDDEGATGGSIAENASDGDEVGITALSTDVHGGTVTYSLTDDADGRFTINATTGVVTVLDASKLDFETDESHTITVQASDGEKTSSQTFTINVTNVAPSQPTDSNAGDNSIAEDVIAGATVGITASSSDPGGGTVTYSLTNNAGGRFAIDSSTGVVTVANAALIDYESSGPSHSYTITVQASDGTDGSTQDFTIDVTDVAPSTPTDSNAPTGGSVAENSANGTLVGITASSADVHGGTVTFSLTDDAGGRFAINSSTGVVTVANGTLLDYETNTSHSITVQASDGTLTSSQNFTIAVTDVLEGPPAGPPVNNGADPNDFDSAVGSSPTLVGGAGNDNNLSGGSGNDIINGLGGDDNIDGKQGDDQLYGGAGNDTITGNIGNDLIYGGSGNDGLSGNGGNDTIYGGSGNDTIVGDNEDDTIFGGSGNDTITGGNGNDRIMGGYGADTLTGGGDADTFVFRSTGDTGDTILDFSQLQGDKIEFNGQQSGNLGGLDFSDLIINQSGGFTYISIDTDPAPGVEFQVKLTGTINLTNSDFIFNA